MNSRNLILGGVLLLVVLAVGFWMMKSGVSSTPTPVVTSEVMEPTSTGSAVMESGMVKEFTVVASNVKYDVTEIKVKKGDKVKINFKNSQGTHNFVLDEFNIKTEVGKDTVVEFTADKSGTFEYYCGVMNHRQMGQKGMLIVE